MKRNFAVLPNSNKQNSDFQRKLLLFKSFIFDLKEERGQYIQT
jgi:hypothetical protein